MRERAKTVTNERWQEIERIFNAATELEHPEQQSDLLDVMCAGDQSLHEEVASLLAVDVTAEGFMESAPSDLAASLLDELSKSGTDWTRPGEAASVGHRAWSPLHLLIRDNQCQHAHRPICYFSNNEQQELAEASGGRTHLRHKVTHTGFEARARHRPKMASVRSPIVAGRAKCVR